MITPLPFKFYGRRKGRPLRTRKAELMDRLMPELEIRLTGEKKLHPADLFSFKPKQIWLEIGFGGGEHLAMQAQNNPAIGFIGCEPFLNGIASLCDHIDKNAITNIRIFPDDARKLLDAMAKSCVDRCFLLFSDPWPKARHAERRFISPENCARLARIMRPGSALCLATDDMGLAEWMRDILAQQPDFKLISDSPDAPANWASTRYEQKAIKAGRQPVYMNWERI